MSGKHVFFTGATGYIGGTVLQSILSSSTPPSSITALIRNEKKADLLKSITLPSGTTITPLVGMLDDADKITDAVSKADIVVHTAHADHVPAIKAIIAGMKKRKEKTGHRPLLIHTSGTGELTDDARGHYPSDRIFTDLNPTPATSSSPALLSIATLPPTAIHRDVDLLIEQADADGICKAYIIMPSTIWGEGKGELYEKGIANSFSDQIPTLIRASLDRGQAGMVGKGANIWPHVNIGDLGHLYQLVYEKAQKGGIGHGKSGYYFGIAGEYTLLAAVETIGSTMVEHKWAEVAQAKSFTPEEMQKYYGGSAYMGSNSRGVASRSKSIGWKPKYEGMDDFVDYIKSETVRAEKKFGRSWGGEGKSAHW